MHHLLEWPAEAILTAGVQQEERAVAWHGPEVGLGHGKDEFLYVAAPSVVVSLTVLSPGNGYAARPPLLVECAAGFPD